jgi:uncharacterized membrane protein YdcZ (DUF606 family)
VKTLFLILAAIITVGSVIPYARDILKGKTKPNIVSWITWTLITGIATAAEIAGHQYFTAIFTGSAVVETALVVFLGLKYGFVKYTRFDVACQLGAIVGLILWQIFNSPTIGVVASVTIDLIGVLPTLRHTWQKPNEETWFTFALASIGAAFSIFSLSHFNVISLTYPVYIVLINIVIASLIVDRQRAHHQSQHILS